MRWNFGFKRFVALITVFFFSWQTAAYSLPVLSVVPKEYGSVTNSDSAREHPAQEPKTVILLLNAHMSSDAQRHIADLLSFFQTHGIDLIGLEGAYQINGEPFRKFPYKEALKQAAWDMVKEGKFTGAEYFYITSDQLPYFYGIEDKALYFENRDAFTKIFELKEKLAPAVEKIQTAVRELKNRIYSNELNRFDDLTVRHHEGQISFLDYVSVLADLTKRSKVQITNFPNFYALSKAIEKERKISLKKLSEELQKIRQSLPRTPGPGASNTTIIAGSEAVYRPSLRGEAEAISGPGIASTSYGSLSRNDDETNAIFELITGGREAQSGEEIFEDYRKIHSYLADL